MGMIGSGKSKALLKKDQQDTTKILNLINSFEQISIQEQDINLDRKS